MTNNSSSAEQPSKRRKIQVACTNCRDRKQRCTGLHPCTACERRGVANECSYDETAWRTQLSVSAETISALEERVARLEQHIFQSNAQQVDAIHISQASTSNNTRRDGAVAETPAEIPDIIPTSHRTFFLKARSSLQDVDGLVTVASPESLSEERFFGRSSTIGFLRHLDHLTGGQEPAIPATDKAVIAAKPVGLSQNVTASFGVKICDIAPGTFIYPPRATADDYVHQFWEYVHPVFPILHKSAFMSDYDKLWTSIQSSRDASASDLLFPSTLNIVFALGCQYSKVVESSQKSRVAAEFYQRARQVFAFDMLDSMSIACVQNLLLMGVYLQSTSSASSCWNSVGLAIRAAQGLGLDLEPTRARSETQLERELRRRVWHTCTVLDRLLSMTFGRPPMILTSRAVPLPQMIDDEYFKEDGEGTQPPDSPSRLGLLYYSSQLLEILQDVLTTLYQDIKDTSNMSRKTQHGFQTILGQALEFNDRLDVFVKDIPEYLLPDSPTQISHVSLQQRVLFCRTCIVRILVLRPILLATIEPGASNTPALQTSTQSSTLTYHLIESACNICVDTAQKMIENLWLHLENTYRSSSWHTVYFIFNSAVILLAATLSPVVKATGVDQHFAAPWDHVFVVLEQYREQVPSAALAIRTLQSFRSRIDRRQKAHEASTSLPTTETGTANTAVANDPEISSLGFDTETGSAMEDSIFGVNFDDFDYAQFGSVSDAWFSQQVVNTDWFCMN